MRLLDAYQGALVGLIPFDVALSLLAKRSYPLYRLWYRYGRATNRLFDHGRTASACDEAQLASLRRDGYVRLTGVFSDEQVLEARRFVLDLNARATERLAELDPSGKQPTVGWSEGGIRHEVTRASGRARFYFPAVMDGDRWPRLLRQFADMPSWHALAESYYRTGTILANLPYVMAEVLTPAPMVETWHIDCVRPTLKSFLYLNDVDVAQGPLKYLAGSQLLDEERHRLFYRICHGGLGHAYFDDAGNAKLDERALLVTAPAGTVTLFDTQGFHSGSRCTSGQRLVLVNGYRPLTTQRLNPRMFRDPETEPYPWER